MEPERRGSLARFGVSNGHDSTDSSYGAPSFAQSQDQDEASGDSTATTSMQEHVRITAGLSESPGRNASALRSHRQRGSHVHLNGRPATPSKGESEAVKEDLWSSILNSVKNSRAVPVKNIVMLGV
jgi:hypothetical protein